MKLFRAVPLYLAFAIYLRAQPVPLGTSGNFAVLAGSTVTNTGSTVITGNVGVSPGTAITGFPPAIINAGVTHSADATAGTAETDLTTAYVNAAGRASTGALTGDIGGLTFLPGVYTAASSLGITGTVTLNGNGNSSSVFIFQIPAALTTAATNSTVNLINGAQASNVFWQVGSSATLGTTTVFNGTILAQASITLGTGAILNGRALARTGAVTLAGNTIVTPAAAGPPAALSVSCAFPNGQVGQPYLSALLAAGGLPPYAYSISAGSLPTGLAPNASTGAIAGTPTAIGTFNFTAHVTDSTPTAATSGCSINIAAATPATTPAPSSLILVLTALALVAAYLSRDRLAKIF